jgi:hypothetical protein
MMNSLFKIWWCLCLYKDKAYIITDRSDKWMHDRCKTIQKTKIEQRNKLLVEENNKNKTSKLIKLKTYIAFKQTIQCLRYVWFKHDFSICISFYSRLVTPEKLWLKKNYRFCTSGDIQRMTMILTINSNHEPIQKWVPLFKIPQDT